MDIDEEIEKNKIDETKQKIYDNLNKKLENQPKFKIGDYVTNKTIGPIWMGRIIAISVAVCCIQDTTIKLWKEKISEVNDLSYVMRVVFDIGKEVKPLSLQEFKHYRPDISEDYLQYEYDKLPKVSLIFHPEEDLELIE